MSPTLLEHADKILDCIIKTGSFVAYGNMTELTRNALFLLLNAGLIRRSHYDFLANQTTYVAN